MFRQDSTYPDSVDNFTHTVHTVNQKDSIGLHKPSTGYPLIFVDNGTIVLTLFV